MRRFAQVLGVLLAVVATGLPTAAGAFPMRFGGFGGARGHVFAGGHAFASPFFGRPFFRPPFVGKPFFHSRAFRAFVVPFPIGFGGWAPFYGYPSPYYGYPPPYGAACGGASYDPTPVAFSIPPTYTPPIQAIPTAPPVPPMPEVVEFPTGRYERRGDGIDTAYRWVWIPNPPTAPPPRSEPGDADTPPARPSPGRLFRWTDDQGVVHLTNLWQSVPPQYRQQAKPPETS